VKGDSMINAGIYQGDALVIDRSIEGKAYHMSA
jgi:SOS-response transcriptional repressor LexA